MRKIVVTTILVLSLVGTGTCEAREWYQPTPEWMKDAYCIHLNESIDWHKTTTWNGFPSWDHGGLQIDVRTWQAMLAKYPLITRGYPSDPADATIWQQYQVAFLIWINNGDRFGGNQWPRSSTACGLP